MKCGRSRRAALLVFAAAAVALAMSFAGVVRWRRASAPPQVEAHALRFAYEWPRGSRYLYDVEWQGDSHVNVQELGGGQATKGADLDARFNLVAQLELRSHGRRGDVFILGARFAHVARHELRLLGRDAMPTDAAAADALEGKEAFLEVDRMGVVRSVYFGADAPPLFRYVMQSVAVLGQAVVHADGNAHWSASETTPLGQGTADYVVEHGSPPRLTRRRRAYDVLYALPGRSLAAADESERGESTITLDPAGHLVTLEEREDLSVRAQVGKDGEALTSHTRFRLGLRAVDRFDASEAPELAALEAISPGAPAPSDATHTALLDARIAGMTASELEADLHAIALVGSVADRGWLLRASALLVRRPDLCMQLAAIFEDARMNERARAQIVDLLAGTGTPEAQDAMRAALDSRVARADARHFDALLQRFSLVEHPTPDTLAFVQSALRDAKTADAKKAAAFALGGAAGNAMRAGDAEIGRQYGAMLVDALEKSRSPGDKRSFLGALGNFGSDEVVPRVRAFAHDGDPGVRAAVAWALRKNDTADARATLMDLAADDSVVVEERAFEALCKETLSSDDLSSLARLVGSGGTRPEADAALVALLGAHQDGGAPVAAMLRLLLARNDADHHLAAQIRHLLAAMA